jgi:hypothetical protein
MSGWRVNSHMLHMKHAPQMRHMKRMAHMRHMKYMNFTTRFAPFADDLTCTHVRTNQEHPRLDAYMENSLDLETTM